MEKKTREELEYKSLFCDERYAKKAWRSLIGASLQGPGKALPGIQDKEGNLILSSQIDQMAYNNVKERLTKEGLIREPMQAELLVECNILRTRFDNATFNTILERTAGKVKDEISHTVNQYEDYTDDELEVLQAYRESKAKSLDIKDEPVKKVGWEE